MPVIRKQHGHFLDDFRSGQVFRHKRGKTVTEGLFAVFTDFSMTTNPLSKNARYARAYGFRDMVVPPGLVMAVVFSQSVEDISENARANLEYIDMRFGVPVYTGDTLEAETTVLGVRPSTRDPTLGVVHVQTTGYNQDGQVALTFQRKVQVWKRNPQAAVADGEVAPREIPVSLDLPPYEASRPYRELAHLSSPDTYLEDFRPGDVLEHSRGRVVTTDHILLTGMLDNTSQVHCNQWMVDQEPERYVGGRLIVFGGIPFNLCRRRRQLARRSALRHRPSYRAHIRGGHGVRLDRDPRGARPAGPAGPRRARGDAPRSQVRRQGAEPREGRYLLSRAGARRETAEPLRVTWRAAGSSRRSPERTRGRTSFATGARCGTASRTRSR